ncbi:hypothetical protein [Bacillus sp. JJ1562]|uniref:hypothetical protein n=1 Tax=Bacillus sp. JJ1562 TaxID=3122960 RepID=UPI003001BE4F
MKKDWEGLGRIVHKNGLMDVGEGGSLMEVIVWIGGILIILAVINYFISIEKELKKLNHTNEKIVGLLEDIKKGSKDNE